MSNPPRTAGEGTAARTSVLGLLIILSAQCLAQVQSPGTCSGKRGPVTQEHPPAASMPAEHSTGNLEEALGGFRAKRSAGRGEFVASASR